MVFEKIKFLAANIAPKPDEVSYWVDISANPYGGVIKYYNGDDWVKLDQLSIAEDYNRLRNKPTLNGVVIEGDKTSNDYNIPTPESVELVLNDFRNEINNIDEKVSNVSIKLDNYIEANDGNIEDIKQDIVNIQESLELILGESASDVIDKFNEILSFLEGYDDSQTLKGVISDLEKMINDAEDDISLLEKEIKAALDSHINDYNNPHQVTKEQVGLDQVDNTSDLNKPISTLTQQALDYEANLRDEMDTELMNRINEVHDGLSQEIDTHIQDKNNPHQVTKEQIGLGNLTNDAQVKRIEMGVSNGVATLDEKGLVPSSQLPSYVDDVIDCYATYDKAEDGTLSNINLYSDSEHSYQIEGESGKIYVDITRVDGAYQFRWTGTQFAVVGAPTVIGEVTGTAFDGARGKALEDKTNAHIANTDNPHQVTKEQVGLNNVDNTADIDKPISTATQSAIDAVKEEINTHISNNNNPHNVTVEQIGAIPTGGLKTINGNSLEGEGDIEVSVDNEVAVTNGEEPQGNEVLWVDMNEDTSSSLDELGIQPKLESGVNIKTINGESILGKGDIVISSSGDGESSVLDLTEIPNVFTFTESTTISGELYSQIQEAYNNGVKLCLIGDYGDTPTRTPLDIMYLEGGYILNIEMPTYISGYYTKGTSLIIVQSASSVSILPNIYLFPTSLDESNNTFSLVSDDRVLDCSMKGYSKQSSYSAIKDSDTINKAIGKLEAGLVEVINIPIDQQIDISQYENYTIEISGRYIHPSSTVSYVFTDGFFIYPNIKVGTDCLNKTIGYMYDYDQNGHNAFIDLTYSISQKKFSITGFDISNNDSVSIYPEIFSIRAIKYK